MARPLALLATLATLVPVSAFAGVTFEPTTCSYPAAEAVRIAGAANEMEGIDAEYRWLADKRPGYKLVRQTLKQGADARQFDMMEIAKGKKTQTICFDITGFYGKM